MRLESTPLNDCFIVHNNVFKDERGFFLESYNEKLFNSLAGFQIHFVQDNHSKSSKGVLRGLHFQHGGMAQAKLVRVLQGAVLDVAVDIRPESSTFGKHFSIVLSADTNTQLFIPRGFAHGFLVLTETADFFYKCDNYYSKEHEGGIIYNDPQINIDWGSLEDKLIISQKDRQLPSFSHWLSSL